MSASPTQSKQVALDKMIASDVVRACRKVGLDDAGIEGIRRRRRELSDEFVALFRRLSAKQPDYALARSILGGDFITAEEIMVKRPFTVYRADMIAALADRIPSAETLNALKAAGYALMPNSPEELALLAIRAAKPEHFYSKTGGWYEKVAFAANDLTGTGWYAQKKTPVTDSTNKTRDEQVSLLSNVEYVPNAAEVSWFVTIFFDVRGVRLLENVYVRTSSLDFDGDHVVVGSFDARGLSVSYYWDSKRYSYLGLASAWKF